MPNFRMKIRTAVNLPRKICRRPVEERKNA